jgi:hypothetical protein
MPGKNDPGKLTREREKKYGVAVSVLILATP